MRRRPPGQVKVGNHPNIVPLIGLSRVPTAADILIVTEYVDGGSVVEWVRYEHAPPQHGRAAGNSHETSNV